MNKLTKHETLNDVIREISTGKVIDEIEIATGLQADKSIKTTPKGIQYTEFTQGQVKGFHILN